MRIAHLADLHLGYRAYHRMGPGGINARERDVALAFRAALDRIVALEPDLVLVAGDVFHTVRPSNSAIADAFRQFASLRARLPGAPVVVIAGNHDSPRAVETGSILRLLAEIPGIHVVDDEARALYLAELDVSVLCLPHNALATGDAVAMEPDPAAGTNLLALHGTVAGGLADEKLRWVSEYGGARVETSEIRPERWDYVALGHYHLLTELAPNMWYAGALERTSTNVWEEVGEKGFLLYDTTERQSTFHSVPTRPVLDLKRFSARGLSPAEVDARIAETLAAVPGGIAGRILRLVIHDVQRELFRELDHRRIRGYRAEALHFHLDARRPESPQGALPDASGPRRTLREEVEGFLSGRWQLSSPEIRRDRLVALGLSYLDRTGRDDEQPHAPEPA